jgi:hypothetical protein
MRCHITKRQLFSLLIALITMITGSTLLSSCYYDNEEYLYPKTGEANCDTLSPTYNATIAPIFAENNCNGCHNASSAGGGIITDNHGDLVSNIDQIWLAINKPSGDPLFMPKNGYKMSNCDLAKIRNWRILGMPNN